MAIFSRKYGAARLSARSVEQEPQRQMIDMPSQFLDPRVEGDQEPHWSGRWVLEERREGCQVPLPWGRP